MQTAIGNDLTAEDAGTIACSGYVSKVLILIVSGLIVYILTYYVQMFLGETFKHFVCGYCQTMKILSLKMFFMSGP